MEPLKASDIKGNWATLLLPINEDESIDFDRLSVEIDQLIAFKVNGIYSGGTAGEFYNLTETEFDQINVLFAQKCHIANMPFQVGCSHMSPIISLERVKRAVQWQPSALQVILPDWTVPNMGEVIAFLQKVHQAAGNIGLIIYNPPHAKKQLTPKDYQLIDAAKVGVIGCKTAGGDAAWYAEMRNAVPEFSIFVPGHALATGIGLGAKGAYSNVACLHPLVAQAWYAQMISEPDKALELESRIQLFIRTEILPLITDQHYGNQAIDKLLAAIGSWSDVGIRLRWPYQSVDDAIVSKTRKAAESILPEFFFL